MLALTAALPAGAQAPVPVGGEFQVNTYTTGSQNRSFVATDADGDFVVVWNSENIVHSVRGQRFASNGSMEGAEFQVNTATTGAQKYPSVAADADGDFVVVWPSFFSFGTDTSYSSVQAQRYRAPASLPLVPAMSRATRFGLGAALLLLGSLLALRRSAR
jgi:hypothetical protein